MATQEIRGTKHPGLCSERPAVSPGLAMTLSKASTSALPDGKTPAAAQPADHPCLGSAWPAAVRAELRKAAMTQGLWGPMPPCQSSHVLAQIHQNTVHDVI